MNIEVARRCDTDRNGSFGYIVMVRITYHFIPNGIIVSIGSRRQGYTPSAIVEFVLHLATCSRTGSDEGLCSTGIFQSGDGLRSGIGHIRFINFYRYGIRRRNKVRMSSVTFHHVIYRVVISVSGTRNRCAPCAVIQRVFHRTVSSSTSIDECLRTAIVHQSGDCSRGSGESGRLCQLRFSASIDFNTITAIVACEIGGIPIAGKTGGEHTRSLHKHMNRLRVCHSAVYVYSTCLYTDIFLICAPEIVLDNRIAGQIKGCVGMLYIYTSSFRFCRNNIVNNRTTCDDEGFLTSISIGVYTG